MNLRIKFETLYKFFQSYPLTSSFLSYMNFVLRLYSDNQVSPFVIALLELLLMKEQKHQIILVNLCLNESKRKQQSIRKSQLELDAKL